LTLKAVFHLPYRQTEGVGKSPMELLVVNAHPRLHHLVSPQRQFEG
jgi:hypothetical protein